MICARGAAQTIALENVLFGDVYLCGGQSNMAMNLRVAHNGTEIIAAADAYSRIRCALVAHDWGCC